MNGRRGITTVPRWLRLNAYALLLFVLGAGVALVPLWCVSLWLAVPQAVVVLVCLRNGLRIVSTWSDKKRKYDLLMQRNADGLRPDTFTDYMQAPCGRALARVVLNDLGCPERYKELKKLKKPLMQRLDCKPLQTVVYINEQTGR